MKSDEAEFLPTIPLDRQVQYALMMYRQATASGRFVRNLSKIYNSPIPKAKEAHILKVLENAKTAHKGREEAYEKAVNKLKEPSFKLFLQYKERVDSGSGA